MTKQSTGVKSQNSTVRNDSLYETLDNSMGRTEAKEFMQENLATLDLDRRVIIK